jgi:2-methylisocitrate lyase-like PEP mutase family enzyme
MPPFWANHCTKLYIAHMSQKDRAAQFRSMHVPVLVLPNAWDAGSARMIEHAGAPAIALGSAGIAWSLGKRDGKLTLSEVVDVARRVTRVATIPVTVDVESGYEDAAATARAMVELGVVGINLEDSPGRNGELLVTADEHAARIEAARKAARDAGGDLVINARTDVFLSEVGPAETRLERALERARTYRRAGADCIFVPGVTDEATIGELAAGIDAPLNVLLRANSPRIGKLKELGVARASAGPRLAEAAHAATLAMAREMLERGTYEGMKHGLYFGDVENIIAPTA